MAYETLRVHRDSSACVLTISRPKALNALNRQVIEDLSRFLEEITTDKDVRVLILTGDGEKSFVAGADISEFQELDEAGALALSEKGHEIMQRLEALSIPVIAAVNGFALGGGLELALACDFIFASENASFGLPEVSLGLIPGYGGTLRLPRVVGLPLAKELIFTGRRIKAEEALRCGLVNRVVPLAQLMATCLEVAHEISSRAPLAVAAAKRSAQRGYSLKLDEGAAVEAHQFARVFSSQDRREGVRAFLEKRQPIFRGE